MIARVWDKVCETPSVTEAVVATDSHKIEEFCNANQINVIMTRDDHVTGSDRLAEVASNMTADVYVNVQGDEPLIEPSAIEAVTQCLISGIRRGIGVSTAYIENATDEQIDDTSVVHLVPALDGTVITFSRLPVPFPMVHAMGRTVHVGLYAFTSEALKKFSTWRQGPVEKAESIEVLRFLEHGERVACVKVPSGSIGVDTPEDAERVNAILEKKKGS